VIAGSGADLGRLATSNGSAPAAGRRSPAGGARSARDNRRGRPRRRPLLDPSPGGFMSRRLARLLGPLAAAFALAALASPATFAQTGKTVRVLVGFPAGGGTDAIARVLADRLKDELGAQVIVENRPGAGGQIAAQALKQAAPDGGTYFISHDHTISIVPQVLKNPGFDPAKDFVHVAGFATFVNALAVSGNLPPKTFGEYVAWVKSQPGGRSAIGVPAPASVPEFLVRLIGAKFALDLVAAPYRGSAPMLGDLFSGQIPAAIASVPELVEPNKAGKLRVVAVLGGQRQAALPDVPTFAELGLAGFEDVPYYAFFAPAGTPKADIDRFAGALAKVIDQPEVRDKLTGWGLAVQFMPQAQIEQRERAYTAAWAQIIKRSGFQPQ
jgi:tripartite-type tricarboxylate transporter receptor subunit TctC